MVGCTVFHCERLDFEKTIARSLMSSGRSTSASPEEPQFKNLDFVRIQQFQGVMYMAIYR